MQSRQKVQCGVLLTVSIAMMAGCSASSPYRDRAEDYRQAKPSHYELPPVPGERDEMPIPEGSSQGYTGDEFVAPRPESMQTGVAERPPVELRKDDQGPWLWVNAGPAKVWPALQRFVEEKDLDVVYTNPRSGELMVRADVGGTPAQRFSLRQGVGRQTAEVRIASMSSGQVLPFSEFDRERMMALEQYLLATQQQQSSRVSLAAQNLDDGDQVRWVDRDGRRLLVLDFAFDRSWGELQNLLSNGFDEDAQRLDDQDRSQGIFYIHYLARSERDSGFWSWLFGSDNADKAKAYRLVLRPSGDMTELHVEDESGQPADIQVEQELLDWVRRQLT